MEELAPWGYHLILDVHGCDHNSITSYDVVYQFAKRLVVDIDMVSFGEPQIYNFGSGNKAGFTLVQLIETSNICAHFVNENDTFYLDVFSCKSFDPDVVVALCEKYFNAKITNKCFFIRKA